MERKIGETFEYEGRKLMVVEQRGYECEKCFFYNKPCSLMLDIIGLCCGRTDKKYVKFIKQPQELNLCEILKNCPTGFELYSSVYGKVKFVSIDEKYTRSWIDVITENNVYMKFTSEGKLSTKYNGECVLFPSKDQRDWSKFIAPWYKKEELIKPKFKVGDIIRHKENNRGNVYKIHRVYDNLYVIDGFAGGIYIKNQDQYELVPNKFDPKTLKAFDRVIVKPDNGDWHCSILSHREDNNIYYRMVDGYGYSRIIPYNDDTKYIVGTTEEAPKFYRYWED